jgi:hypothetical protein
LTLEKARKLVNKSLAKEERRKWGKREVGREREGKE